MRKVFFIILVLQLSACEWFTSASSPFMSLASPNIPDGTPIFQKGFKDGCSSANYSRGNGFYRSINSGKYDPTMIGSSEYRFGHKRGYSWCFTQAASSTSGAVGSWDRVISPYGYNAGFSSKNINQAWGGMFSGTTGKAMGETVGGNVGGFMGVFSGSGDNSLFGANPLWAGGSKGQIFGQ